MTHRLTTNYAKNYCNRTLIVNVIVENVVTFLGGTRCRRTFTHKNSPMIASSRPTLHVPRQPYDMWPSRIITNLYHKTKQFHWWNVLLICVEWASDHFGLGLTYIDPLLTEDMSRKWFYIFCSQWAWPLIFRSQICSSSYSCPALSFHWISSFYCFPASRKSEAWDRRMDKQTDGYNN